MIILIGASASGKTEIAKLLCKNNGFHKLVTYTSREMRVGEINHQDYHFVTKEKFIDGINNNFFLEYVNYNGNYYGTAYEDIDDMSVVILEPGGYKTYREKGVSNVVAFFLDSSYEKRKERMLYRGDDIASINKRLSSDDQKFDVNKMEDLDYIMNSNDLTVTELATEINKLYRQKIGLNI